MQQPGMAFHRRLDVSQRRSPGKLTKQDGQQLVASGERANEFVAPVFLNQSIENMPRKTFYKIMENGTLHLHGAGSIRVQMSR
jgi:hypothetical protein